MPRRRSFSQARNRSRYRAPAPARRSARSSYRGAARRGYSRSRARSDRLVIQVVSAPAAPTPGMPVMMGQKVAEKPRKAKL